MKMLDIINKIPMIPKIVIVSPKNNPPIIDTITVDDMTIMFTWLDFFLLRAI